MRGGHQEVSGENSTLYLKKEILEVMVSSPLEIPISECNTWKTVAARWSRKTSWGQKSQKRLTDWEDFLWCHHWASNCRKPAATRTLVICNNRCPYHSHNMVSVFLLTAKGSLIHKVNRCWSRGGKFSLSPRSLSDYMGSVMWVYHYGTVCLREGIPPGTRTEHSHGSRELPKSS